ncbi:MAG: 3-phosphoglycerate kinase [Pseudomonas sp.]
MKKLLCVAITLLPLGAFAYPIELEKQLNGAEVSSSTQDIGDNMGAVLLQNVGQSKTECTAVFTNGPETPRVRKAVMKPGESANMAVKFNRAVIRLRIKLTCNPQ